MLHSNERMDLITEYMTSYEEKIKMTNKNGLFDAAKMFELFAVEVCNVWFGQKFINLNIETATYPYVDIISENRELLVQVSTVQDVPTKIKNTLEKINERYISIQGGAGSGKSVLCKKYVENQELVLCARSERFLEESHIDNIWDCCIQDVLECLNGKKLIFFIDALEFIADCAKTKFELLQYLFDMAAKHQNVYIVTSCRTSDKSAFIKLETKNVI